jgi:uncharacterized membrane protein HdeD (DUF308 family)
MVLLLWKSKKGPVMVNAIGNAADRIGSKWWLLLLRGIAAIVVAVIAFMQPGLALISFVLVLGIYSLVAGVLAIMAAFSLAGADHWWALLFEGILGIVVAFVIWNWPITATVAFVYFVAAWLIVTGVLQIAAGIRFRDVIGNEWLYIIAGVVSIAFGVWVFHSPLEGSLATAFLIAWYFLFFGILQVGLAFRLRSMHTTVASAIKGT